MLPDSTTNLSSLFQEYGTNNPSSSQTTLPGTHVDSPSIADKDVCRNSGTLQNLGSIGSDSAFWPVDSSVQAVGPYSRAYISAVQQGGGYQTGS